MTQHSFGGPWTEEKLARLRKYLTAYATIFARNPGALHLRTTYVDAFAGTGTRVDSKSDTLAPQLLFDDIGMSGFRKGSARIALEITPPFDHYLFIEQCADRAAELMALKAEFPHLVDRVFIANEEANSCVRRWCANTDWRHNRAVVFLDPYGMQVEWPTIEAVAQTHAIDLWLLFPLGQAVNRLLTRDGLPDAAWAASLFAGVAPQPLALHNSRNVPIYLLCFAAGNRRCAETAVKIANDLLKG
jgi:three-Cys-motif partner protein